MSAILILGAAYGLLPGAKLSLAGHAVTLIGRAGEIESMALHPLEVRIAPRRAGAEIVLTVPVAVTAGPGRIALTVPERADPAGHDLIILAMQEPQYRDPAVAELMARIAASGRPCLSIMNLAPPPFLTRLGIGAAALHGVYASGDVWAQFDPRKMTLASPDPQAVRPDPAEPGRLQVTLPSNFKAAPFALAEDQALLQRLAADMTHLEVAVGGAMVRPPVALIASSSLFVPLAKWPMLIAGNCRCVLPAGIRTIAETVLSDSAASAAVYEQVRQLTLALGAREQDLVPFAAYAKAAERLARPSSLARAIEAGASQIERIDRLIGNLLAAHGLARDLIEPVAALIDARLAQNRVGAGMAGA
jgi:hypothetical protein